MQLNTLNEMKSTYVNRMKIYIVIYVVVFT